MGISADFILGISGSIIIILLGIIAFFLKDLIAKIKQMTETIAVILTRTEVQGSSCKLIHAGVDARLAAHSKGIEKINNQLKQKG
ncbi:MAG: hypothetical protein ACOYOV_13965 [Bacteroidales bacterium]